MLHAACNNNMKRRLNESPQARSNVRDHTCLLEERLLQEPTILALELPMPVPCNIVAPSHACSRGWGDALLKSFKSPIIVSDAHSDARSHSDARPGPLPVEFSQPAEFHWSAWPLRDAHSTRAHRHGRLGQYPDVKM